MFTKSFQKMKSSKVKLIVKFPREGYNIKSIFVQKTYSNEIAVKFLFFEKATQTDEI